MPPGRMGVVESVHGQVQNPVGRVGILQYFAVRRPLRELGLETPRGDEIIGIQIASADRKEVCKDQDADQQRGDALSAEPSERIPREI